MTNENTPIALSLCAHSIGAQRGHHRNRQTSNVPKYSSADRGGGYRPVCTYWTGFADFAWMSVGNVCTQRATQCALYWPQSESESRRTHFVDSVVSNQNAEYDKFGSYGNCTFRRRHAPSFVRPKTLRNCTYFGMHMRMRCMRCVCQ